MSILEIKTNKPLRFNLYLVSKIKADLKKSALIYNPSFQYRGKILTIQECIKSLSIEKGRIHFASMYLPIKHLIYNNRQLFWLDVINKYKATLNREYLIWSRLGSL